MTRTQECATQSCTNFSHDFAQSHRYIITDETRRKLALTTWPEFKDAVDESTQMIGLLNRAMIEAWQFEDPALGDLVAYNGEVVGIVSGFEEQDGEITRCLIYPSILGEEMLSFRFDEIEVVNE